MENDPAYTTLLNRQQAGETLTPEEQKTLNDNKSRLTDYFDKLSDNEKSIYFKNRAKWAAQPGTVDQVTAPQEEEVYAGERSKYTQYVVSSGLFGLLYGGAIDYLANVTDPGVAGAIPLLTAGASTLIPMLIIKDKKVNYNSLALAMHGKALGGLQGVALGLLITGSDLDDDSKGKLVVGLATASSIGLGRLGFVLGRDKPWSQGRAALYTHYGIFTPLEGLSVVGALKADDPRLYGIVSLACGAGGYLIADQVARKNDFTRGDVTAISTLTTLNGLLGLFIASDISGDSETGAGLLMLPAVGAIGGTIAGQIWLKDARLTPQQGRNTALASTGGALIGAGLVLIFNPDKAAPYYLTSYAAGMTAYSILVSKYKKANKTAYFEEGRQSRWSLNLAPQNILLNRKIEAMVNANPGRRIGYLPAFSATLNF